MAEKTTPTTPVEPTTKPQEEMVQVPKSTLEQMQAKLDSFDAFITSQEDKNKPFSRAALENITRKVKVHFYKGLPVIAYGQTHKRKSEDGQQVLFIEFITEDKALHVVNMLEYFSDETNSPWCEIVDIKVRPEIVSQGSVQAVVVEWDQYKSYYSDKQVSLDVVYKRHDYLVKLPDGRELLLNESVIN
jgi:hypothetical protein